MTAKQIQIRRLNLMIDRGINEAEKIKRIAEELMQKYADMQKEIDKLTDQLVDMKENE